MEKIVAYFANGMTIAGFIILYAAYSGTLYKAVSKLQSFQMVYYM